MDYKPRQSDDEFPREIGEYHGSLNRSYDRGLREGLIYGMFYGAVAGVVVYTIGLILWMVR